MSYILDALRKADAERERGNVPGINAQPMFAAAPPRSAPRASRPWWIWLIAAVLVILALAVAALLWRLNTANSSRTSGEQTGAGSSTPTALPAASVAASAATVPPLAVVPQAATAKPIAREAPVVHNPRPTETSASRSLVPKPPAQSATQPNNAVPGGMSGTAPKSQSQEQARSAGGTPTSTSGESHVYTVNELPDDIRRQLPALAVGASIYSNTPANRILIINGQVLHEGETVISGLVLEQIKLKAAVLAFKGFRFIITY